MQFAMRAKEFIDHGAAAKQPKMRAVEAPTMDEMQAHEHVVFGKKSTAFREQPGIAFIGSLLSADSLQPNSDLARFLAVEIELVSQRARAKMVELYQGDQSPSREIVLDGADLNRVFLLKRMDLSADLKGAVYPMTLIRKFLEDTVFDMLRDPEIPNEFFTVQGLSVYLNAILDRLIDNPEGRFYADLAQRLSKIDPAHMQKAVPSAELWSEIDPAALPESVRYLMDIRRRNGQTSPNPESMQRSASSQFIPAPGEALSENSRTILAATVMSPAAIPTPDFSPGHEFDQLLGGTPEELAAQAAGQITMVLDIRGLDLHRWGNEMGQAQLQQ